MSVVKQEEKDEGKEWCQFEHKPGHKFYDFEEARAEIQTEVNKRAGTNKGIVKTELTLSIHSTHVINLTLVDLPGIVEVRIWEFK